MAATDKKLGVLHDMVADVLISAMKGTETPEFDDEGELTGKTFVMLPSAALIQAATKFLKDNEITAVVSEDTRLGTLADAMKARQAERQARQAARPTLDDLDSADEQANFMSGLN